VVDINHVILLGRLTRDSELKTLASGQAVCKFSIAVNRRKKQAEGQWIDEANFFDIVLWGRQGEILSQYLVKGKQVAIDGELRQDRWEQDGQNRSKIEIIANNVQLLGGGQGNGSSGGGSYGGQRSGSYAGGAGSGGGYGGAPSGGNSWGASPAGGIGGGGAAGSAGGVGGFGGSAGGGAVPSDASFTDDVPF
jgi:single-strand DNA-binding protein